MHSRSRRTHSFWQARKSPRTSLWAPGQSRGEGQTRGTVQAAGKLRGRAAVALRRENLSLAQLGERLGVSKARAADIVRDTTRTSRTLPVQTEPPVVAVIVTAPEGVLAIRRTDGNPPWTFPGGEIEPGETPAVAGRREVKEETGLDIVTGRVLGKRIHPQTGRQVIYLAARPAQPSVLVRRNRMP
jgi:NUDIX domain